VSTHTHHSSFVNTAHFEVSDLYPVGDHSLVVSDLTYFHFLPGVKYLPVVISLGKSRKKRTAGNTDRSFLGAFSIEQIMIYE
jgi:hypothetical protein